MIVKVLLEGNETPEEGDEELYKALQGQRDGSTHSEDFSDPAMRDTTARIIQIHNNTFERMLSEILEILDEEPKTW